MFNVDFVDQQRPRNGRMSGISLENAQENCNMSVLDLVIRSNKGSQTP